MTYAMAWKWRESPCSYELRGDDVITLARAVEFEGLPSDAVLWCLLQRFAYLSALERGLELAAFVRSYALSINPLWFEDGARHLEHVEHLRNTGRSAEASFERRKALQRPIKAGRPWELLALKTRELVTETMRGARPNACLGAVHYWPSRANSTMTELEARALNQTLRAELMLLDIGAGFGPGVNVFFASANSGHLTGLTLAQKGMEP